MKKLPETFEQLLELVLDQQQRIEILEGRSRVDPVRQGFLASRERAREIEREHERNK